MDLLKNDLDFSISSRFLKKRDVFCQFDMIVKFMTEKLGQNQITTLYLYILLYMNIKRPSIVKKENKILQKLKCNRDIVFTHSDKGNGVVRLKRRIY